MLNSARKYLFTLFMGLLFYSCVKKVDPPVPNYGNYSPPVALWEYCYFKAGSYWVYQDSASLKLDCVYVSNASMQTYEVKASDGKDYTGTFHYYYTKTYDGIGDWREYRIYDEDAAESAKCCQGRYYCETVWNRPPKNDSTPGIYFGTYTYVFNVFNNGVTGGRGFSGNFGEQCWSRGIIESMAVKSKTYANIVVFENQYKGDYITGYMKFHTKNYLSKNIGLIKRIDMDSNRTWLLKNYLVIQ